MVGVDGKVFDIFSTEANKLSNVSSGGAGLDVERAAFFVKALGTDLAFGLTGFVFSGVIAAVFGTGRSGLGAGVFGGVGFDLGGLTFGGVFCSETGFDSTCGGKLVLSAISTFFKSMIIGTGSVFSRGGLIHVGNCTNSNTKIKACKINEYKNEAPTIYFLFFLGAGAFMISESVFNPTSV